MSAKWMPENAGLITPYLTVRDADAAAKFYAAAFGFVQANAMPGPGGKPVHVDMTYRGQSIVMFSPENAPWGGDMKAPASSGTNEPVGFYLYCEDVDALHKQALAAGAKAEPAGGPDGGAEPQDMFWGDRIATVQDPDGYRWTLATKVGEFDISKAPKFDQGESM